MNAAQTKMATGAGRCQEAQRAIMEAMALEEVPERQVAHAEECGACGALLERARALALMAHGARRAHERLPDLSPTAWVRIREGVDTASRTSRAGWGFLALAVGAVAAVVFLAWPRGGDAGGDSVAPAVASGRGIEAHWGVGGADLGRPHAGEAVAAARVLRASEGGVALGVAAGDHLRTAAGERFVDAFGRHHLAIAPGSDVAIRRWDADGMELAVEAGTASFEVTRASADETFVVWSGDVAVHVKGTIFTVERLGSGGTRVTVERGRVAVSRRGDPDEVMVQAGERVVFPALTAAANEVVPGRDGRPALRRVAAPTPRAEKVIEIDLGHERGAAASPGDGVDVGHLMPGITMAMRGGRCVQALNALGEITKALGPQTPRNVTWLTAWCKRKLGDLEGSRALFQRYGGHGPWPIPAGDELPALP